MTASTMTEATMTERATTLDGKAAIVTAAAGAGIGRATAHRLARAGAHVLVTDANENRALTLAAAMDERYPGTIVGLKVDVRDGDDMERMTTTCMDRFGRIDILVNNAGINKLAQVRDMDDDTWQLVIDVNLTGTFRCTRAVLPAMIERESGAVVNVASSAAWIGPSDGESHYCAAKAGVMAFTRAVAAEVASHGIRVNAIAPGLIYNEFLGRIYPREFFDRVVERIPLARPGEPDEVAGLIAFLASDDARYITGESIGISGGAVMKA